LAGRSVLLPVDMRGAGWLDSVDAPHEPGATPRVGRLPHLEPAHVERCGEAQRERVRSGAPGARRPRASHLCAAAGVGRRSRGIGHAPAPAILAGGGGSRSVLLLLRPGDAGGRWRPWRRGQRWRPSRRGQWWLGCRRPSRPPSCRRRQHDSFDGRAAGIARHANCIDVLPSDNVGARCDLDAAHQEAGSGWRGHREHGTACRAIDLAGRSVLLPVDMRGAGWLDSVDAPHEPGATPRVGRLPHLEPAHVERCGEAQRERVRSGAPGARRPRASHLCAAAGVGRRSRGIGHAPAPAILAGGGGSRSVLLLLRPGDAGGRRRRRWGAGPVDASRRVAHELYCIDILPCIERRLRG